jgi:hypothetical protein
LQDKDKKRGIMKEIAYTTFGRNALVIGLISHITALLVGMMPVSDSASLFSILYVFYWIVFICAVYKELRDRGYRPSGNWRFYVATASAIIPILGPMTALMMLYRMQDNNKMKQDKSPGFSSAILRLRANALLIFLFIVIIFILFAVMLSRNDPYFKRKVAGSILPTVAFAAEHHEFINFVSEEKYFSVLVPSGWEKDETCFLKEYKEYGVRLRAPGLKDLGYVLIDIAYYAEKHRTPERFIFDKQNPVLALRGEEQSPVQDMTTEGMKAKTFEIKTSRFPIAGIGDAKVDAIERYVVFPAPKGFFVLWYTSPYEITQKYSLIFEKVLHSFKPLTTAQAVSGNKDEITEEEYSVYTEFFKIKEVPKIDSPVPHLFPSKGTLVYEKTSSGKKITQGFLKSLEKSSGKLDASLIESYNSRNTKDYYMKDKILVNTLKILTEERMEEIKKKGGLGKGFAQEFMRSYPLAGDIIYLSRVGFSRDKANALFHAGSSSGLTGASYFILMEKTGNAWQLKNALLNNFWYY